MAAHIGWHDPDNGLVVVWCDRHGDVLVTANERVSRYAVRVHDLCGLTHIRGAQRRFAGNVGYR